MIWLKNHIHIATTIDNSFRSELSKLQITPEFLKTTVHKDQNESEKYIFNLDFCLPDNFDFSILPMVSPAFNHRTNFSSYFDSCSRSLGTGELVLSNFKIFSLCHTDNNKYKIILTGIAQLEDKDVRKC